MRAERAIGMPNGRAGFRGGSRRVRLFRRPVVLWTSLLGTAALLTLYPQLDHWAAGLFYRPGVGFPAELDPTLQLLRDLVLVPAYALLGAMALSVVHRWLRGRYLLGLDRRVIVYLIGVAAVGIGLIANALLKENWGRARPRQTVEYGGTAAYTPPLVIADECERNCSFVAGEGAYGFMFLAFGFLASRRRRLLVFASAAAFGSAVGLIRVAMGAHYLSDVYFAALVMLGVSWLLYRCVVVKDVTKPVFRLLGFGRPAS